MITGKSKGLKKGDFVFTGFFPGIIISDVHTATPCCEVWGFEHEGGSAYASDMFKITFDQFLEKVREHGWWLESLNPFSDVSKQAIREATIARAASQSNEIAKKVVDSYEIHI